LNPTTIQFVAAVLFAVAILHTFSVKLFERLAHKDPRHGGVWHLLAEVEVVFGFWAMVMMLFMFALEGTENATHYLDDRNFTEPMFVFAIMVIAATRPVLQFSRMVVSTIATILPLPRQMASFFTVLFVVPLLGSFITEPAAMTVGAMILSTGIFSQGISERLKYAALAVLFVNVSIGGTLTPYAAPPILMVAAKWNWDMPFMLATFGWRSALAALVNAGVLTFLFRKELAGLPAAAETTTDRVPLPLIVIHLAFLALVVVFSHHPAMFLALFLFFLGVVQAYRDYQDRLILREGLLVAFFLAGLVVLGGQQQWWLQPLLMSMSTDGIFFGATALTAVTDNAALTYLGSLVEGLTDEFKYALVAGAVTGGGLTVIANAPNPAGLSILRGHFRDETVNPFGLLISAIPPTLVAVVAFWFI
jgi:Protein of unknown function (DUF1504).